MRRSSAWDSKLTMLSFGFSTPMTRTEKAVWLLLFCLLLLFVLYVLFHNEL